MVKNIRLMETALGSSKKDVVEEENETVIVQRRSSRLKTDMKKGSIINKKNLIFLRPCSKDGVPPYKYNFFIGKKLKKNLTEHDELNYKHV